MGRNEYLTAILRELEEHAKMNRTLQQEFEKGDISLLVDGVPVPSKDLSNKYGQLLMEDLKLIAYIKKELGLP